MKNKLIKSITENLYKCDILTLYGLDRTVEKLSRKGVRDGEYKRNHNRPDKSGRK